MRRIVALMLMALFFGPASAGDSGSALEAEVAGTSQRVWIRDRIVLFKDLKASCGGGYSLNFGQEGKVRIRECVNGRIQESDQSWAVRAIDDDNFLRIGEEEYQVSFSGTDCKRRMRLRLATASKAGLTQDIYLSRDCT